LDVETDGTITPEEAVQKAAEILASQFSWIMEGGRVEMEEVDIEAPVEVPEKEEVEEEVEEAPVVEEAETKEEEVEAEAEAETEEEKQ
jgi:DNA-directed RNA polymerase alpha subunit